MSKPERPLEGDALIKEVCRRIRVARQYWDAHNNRACRREREQALRLYNTLTKPQKEKVPQVLRIWLRYRSEKYFGPDSTPPRGASGGARGSGDRHRKPGRHRRDGGGHRT